MTIDPELNVKYAAMAAKGGNLRGLSLLLHEKPIRKLIRNTGSKSILDYGSGAGDAYTVKSLHKLWGVDKPVLYDPAFPSHSEKPEGQFDGVICNDVMEHVPEYLVEAVIDELFAYATRFVFASVCCRPAAKKFADGQNLHVTVKPFAWWQEKFKRKGPLLLLVESP
jgi:hypothetical protein